MSEAFDRWVAGAFAAAVICYQGSQYTRVDGGPTSDFPTGEPRIEAPRHSAGVGMPKLEIFEDVSSSFVADCFTLPTGDTAHECLHRLNPIRRIT